MFDDVADVETGISPQRSIEESIETLCKKELSSPIVSTAFARQKLKNLIKLNNKLWPTTKLTLPHLYFAKFAEFMDIENKVSLCLISPAIYQIVVNIMPIDLSHRYVSMECLKRLQRPIIGFQVPLKVKGRHDLSLILHRGSKLLKILLWDRTGVALSYNLPLKLSEFGAIGLIGLHRLECINCFNIYGSLKELSLLTKLEIVSLKGCSNITGNLSSLTTLSRLSSLNLSQLPSISGDIDSLTTLVELRDFNFSGCHSIVYHMDSIAKFVFLERLQLNFISLPISMDLGRLQLADLVNLKVIDLTNNATVEGNLSSLATLSELEFLSLHGCLHIRGNIASLSKLLKLTHLDLQGLQNITGRVSSLLNISSLHYLNVSLCRLIIHPSCLSFSRISNDDILISIDKMRFYRIPFIQPPSTWCDLPRCNFCDNCIFLTLLIIIPACLFFTVFTPFFIYCTLYKCRDHKK